MNKQYFSKRGVALPVVVGIIALIIVAGIGIAAFQKSSEKEMMEEKDDNMMEKEDEAMMEEKDAMMKDGKGMMEYSGKVLAGTKAPLLDFVKSDYNAALKTDKLVVLYFYANWCPECKAEIPKLYAAFNELETEKVIGFRVNYNDNETDSDEKMLAREFGVGYQHTKVFVKKGERILKSPEGWDKARYLTEINKYTK